MMKTGISKREANKGGCNRGLCQIKRLTLRILGAGKESSC